MSVKQVKCGKVLIGGGAPVSIQSMTNVDTRNEEALFKQVKGLEEAGCDIVRVAVPDDEAVRSFSRVKKIVDIPMVADIHFDYKLAIAAIEGGADKIRINPGNIGSRDKVKAVVDTAKEHGIPIRVGVNSGSLEKEILDKYGRVNAEGLAESAIKMLESIEDMGFDDLVLSIKSSDVRMTYDAHRIASKMTDHPMHIGITESGTPGNGIIKSSIGIGALLLSGIGDTIRVSLTDDPVNEVVVGRKILESIGLRESSIDIVSCPTCGRTEIDLIALANEVQARFDMMSNELKQKGVRPLKIAVMGCAVNGPGESREADYGVAGGKGEGLVFSKGEILCKVPEDRLVDTLIDTIKKEEDMI